METSELRMTRKPGRPRKLSGSPFVCVTFSLPPEHVELLRQEAIRTGQPSLSAAMRRVLAEHLRRLDKRRDRQERQAGEE